LPEGGAEPLGLVPADRDAFLTMKQYSLWRCR
jgi:hypothetical protein